MTDNNNEIIDHRLAALKEKIAASKAIDKKMANPETQAKDESLKNTMRVATDIIGTPIVCGAIGMGMDEWFSTAPFGFLIMAFLGVCAGFWNLYRAQMGVGSEVGFKRLRLAKKQGKRAQFLDENNNQDPTP